MCDSENKHPPVELEIGGIQCDNTECDYEDMDAEFDPEYFLNRPCPKCGASLFTEEDYHAMQIMIRAAGAVNKIFKDRPVDPNEERVVLDVQMNGTGVPTFKVTDKE